MKYIHFRQRAAVAAVAMPCAFFFASGASADTPSATPDSHNSDPPSAVAPPTSPLAPSAAEAQPAVTPTPSATPASANAPTVNVESAQAGPQGAAPPAAKPALPDWMQGVQIGAGAVLWYYQPIVPRAANVNNDVSVFWANLLVDGKWGPLGLHLEPRFRDTKLRPFFDGPAWLQEAYASADLGVARVRIGKTYSQLGLFWDNSFYGNVQVYDGLKLDPDYGISVEGDVGRSDAAASLGWWAQYFVVDGGTNVSIQGRDTISLPGARRRNQAIARLEPRFHFEKAVLTLGGSGEFFQAADLPEIGTQNVWRAAADAKFTREGLGAWTEFLHQDGRSVTDFPTASTAQTATTSFAPGSSAQVDYFLAGVEYTLGSWTARYNLSLGSYKDVSIKEWMHVPAVGFKANDKISLLGELVFWQRDTPAGSLLVDRSFNLTLSAHL